MKTAIWKEAARILHKINPKLYSGYELSRLFNKAPNTVWLALNPNVAKEIRKDYYRKIKDTTKYKERNKKNCKAYYDRNKNNPEWLARKKAVTARHEATRTRKKPGP